MNFFEPEQTKRAFTVVFDPKKDGMPRICVDFRKINAVTTPDLYLLQRLDECMDT